MSNNVQQQDHIKNAISKRQGVAVTSNDIRCMALVHPGFGIVKANDRASISSADVAQHISSVATQIQNHTVPLQLQTAQQRFQLFAILRLPRPMVGTIVILSVIKIQSPVPSSCRPAV